MTGSQPPAGWYPDPSNDQQLRWWTGERWTGAARPLEFDEPQLPTELTQPGASAEGWAAGGSVATDPSETGSADAEPAGLTSETPNDRTSDLTREVSSVSAYSTAWGQQSTADRTHDTAAGNASTWPDQDRPGEAARRGREDGWPRERMIAAVAIGGLLLTSVAIWLIAVVLTGPGDPEIVAGGPTTEDEGDADGTDDGTDADGDTDLDGLETTESLNEAEDPDADGIEGTVDFDGVCSVELDGAAADRVEALRPWQFDECEHAPISLDGADGRWIVVIASMDGDLDASEAEARARDRGGDYGLLWSSHYPSLNPGWWVVFDGPFAEEDAATEMADEIGGGSYPRLLSDDEGDRYCIAEDGC